MNRTCRSIAALALGLAAVSINALAASEETVKELEACLDFVDYGATILPEQIPEPDWKRFVIVDARDADPYAKEPISGAINIDWRQTLARRGEPPKDKPILVYCNTGSLPAQAGLALRVAGTQNVRILQGGFAEWKAKGGFDAYRRATESGRK